MVLVVWMLSYTLSLLDLGLLLYRYLQHRHRGLLYLLLLVVDIVTTIAVIMVLLAIRVPNRPFAFILGNFLLTFYVTVPYFAYETSGVAKPLPLIYGSLLVAAILVNGLIVAGDLWVIDGVSWVPLCVSFVPLFLRDDIHGSDELTEPAAMFRRRLGRVGMALGGLAFGLVFLFLFLVRTVFRTDAFFQDTYFAFFMIIYQLPVLYLLIRGVPAAAGNEPRPVVLDLARLSLTPREEEVARGIYAGLTYSQIANAMFVTLSAVKKHAYNIYRKTGVRNNRQLIRKMIGSSPADPPEKP